MGGQDRVGHERNRHSTVGSVSRENPSPVLFGEMGEGGINCQISKPLPIHKFWMYEQLHVPGCAAMQKLTVRFDPREPLAMRDFF